MTFTVVKGALEFADPGTFLAVRFTLAALLLLPFAGRNVWRRDIWWAGLLLSLAVTGCFALQTIGLLYTTPSRSAFITGLCVILVPVFSAVLFRELPKRRIIVSVLLATAGLYVLTWSPAGEVSSTWVGDLLTLACAACTAAHVLMVNRFTRRLPVLPLVVAQQSVAALMFLPWLWIPSAHWVPHPKLWGGLGVGVAVSSGVAWLNLWSQARTSAAKTAVIYALEPVFAVLFSTLWGGERLGARGWAGGGLVLSGVLISELGGHWRPRGRE